jgi:CPA1 family monovalent cation:H+ antiporter
MAILLLTVLVAYGSFLVAEHYLHLSGVLATVGAGLFLGSEEDIRPRQALGGLVQDVWDTMGWLVTTALYILIGSSVNPIEFMEHARLVAIAAVLVVLVRAVTIYPLVLGSNWVLDRPVPLRYQHIMVWGGLHTVVPVALVLSLPEGFPQRATLETMVFSVAIASIVIQGLLMPKMLDLTRLAGDADTRSH